MSALGIQSQPELSASSTFGTKDPVLAATLGNFGFLAKESIPVMLVVHSARVVDLVDKKRGRIDDLAHTEFRFEDSVLHDAFGRVNAYDISLAHEIAKLAQKEQTKEISGAEKLSLQKLRERWQSKRIGPSGVDLSGTILLLVQMLYDQVTNFMVVATVTKELSKNPMVEFAKQMHKGVAYAVQPLEAEPQAQRMNEKFFKK